MKHFFEKKKDFRKKRNIFGKNETFIFLKNCIFPEKLNIFMHMLLHLKVPNLTIIATVYLIVAISIVAAVAHIITAIWHVTATTERGVSYSISPPGPIHVPTNLAGTNNKAHTGTDK